MVPRAIVSVDDHQVMGYALQAALHGRPDLRLVGAYPTVDALLRADRGPALALLDLRLGDGSSPTDNVRRIREAGGDVLVFTSGDDAHLVREALRTDVLGVLRKSAPVPVLIEAVERAARGLPVVTSDWAHALETDPRLDHAGLSPKEARVLQRFADGARSPIVATELGITVGTLEDYLRRIRLKYAKAGRTAVTKIDLYKRAVQDGHLPGPGRG